MTETKVRKILTIEVPDDRNKGAEDSDSDSDNSKGGNAGVIPSADSRVPYPSPQSNDSNNVGKSVADAESSDAIQNIISSLSYGTPSSHSEANGNLNGGKRNDEPSAQQGGQSPQPDGIPSGGNGYYHQKLNGYDNPNGFQSDK